MAKRIDRGVGNINDIPDDVLCHIISFLPTKDAVRTSILSTRWRHLFALLSNLDLEVDANNVEELKRFTSFVDGLMSNLDMPSMVKFRLRYGGSILHRTTNCGGFIQRVGDWICALIRHNIQELDIRINTGLNNCVFLPPMLLLCESLVVLKLNLNWSAMSMLNIHDRIYLPNLKIIHFGGTYYSNEISVEKLFPSCPVLEDLVLHEFYFTGSSARLNVSNQNLKTLTLGDIMLKGESETTRILINTPSLVILNYHISSSYSLEFVNVKSLSGAIITSDSYMLTKFLTTTPDAISWIHNFETLRIHFCVVRELHRFKVSIPLFEKITYLKIWFRECSYDPIAFDPTGLEYFLAHCVVLETLVFEESRVFDLRRTNKRYLLQESQLAPLLCHVKTIEIHLLDTGHMKVLMNVVKFFLKNSKVLELLKINSKQGRRKDKFKITKRLMNCPGASKNCSVLFFSDTWK